MRTFLIAMGLGVLVFITCYIEQRLYERRKKCCRNCLYRKKDLIFKEYLCLNEQSPKYKNYLFRKGRNDVCGLHVYRR